MAEGGPAFPLAAPPLMRAVAGRAGAVGLPDPLRLATGAVEPADQQPPKRSIDEGSIHMSREDCGLGTTVSLSPRLPSRKVFLYAPVLTSEGGGGRLAAQPRLLEAQRAGHVPHPGIHGLAPRAQHSTTRPRAAILHRKNDQRISLKDRKKSPHATIMIKMTTPQPPWTNRWHGVPREIFPPLGYLSSRGAGSLGGGRGAAAPLGQGVVPPAIHRPGRRAVRRHGCGGVRNGGFMGDTSAHQRHVSCRLVL
jgi:hypothetical protein